MEIYGKYRRHEKIFISFEEKKPFQYKCDTNYIMLRIKLSLTSQKKVNIWPKCLKKGGKIKKFISFARILYNADLEKKNISLEVLYLRYSKL